MHPVFAAFPGFVGSRPKDILLDYVGAQFRGIWDSQPHVPAIEGSWQTPIPDVNEEYFEWIDVLESVQRAQNAYTMLELGAGYGRWGVRAGLAARRKGIKNISIVFVEGEPKHAAWIGEAVQLNGLSSAATVLQRAISYEGQPVPFLVGHDSLDVGFGQCLGWEGGGAATGDTYFGKPVHRTPAGYHQIFVAPTTLEAVTEGLVVVDLIDMDLQRAERDVIRNSMQTLNDKVRRVHIGTHAPEIEEELRAAFTASGWKCVWDFGCNRENPTPYGQVSFLDGIQSWINPRV